MDVHLTLFYGTSKKHLIMYLLFGDRVSYRLV